MADAGRVICARCGANNFSTQAACWKCAAPLSGAAPAHASAAPPLAAHAPSPHLSGPAASGVARDLVDPAIAFWCAIALAAFFPSVGIIVGLVFLMLDDRRRIEIGRITLIWSIVFFIIHTVVTTILIQGVIHQFLPAIGALRGTPPQQPGMNDTIPSKLLPSGFNNPAGFPGQ